MNVGEEIASVRRARGLTVRELARLAGVADTTIARIERGQLDPSIGVVDRVLAALGRSLAVVEGAPPPSPAAFAPGSVEEELFRHRGDVTALLEEVGCSRPRLSPGSPPWLIVDTPAGWGVRDSYALTGKLLGVIDHVVKVVAEAHTEPDEIGPARPLW